MKINHDFIRKSSFQKDLYRWRNQRSILGYARNRFNWHVLPRIYFAPAYPNHMDIELSSRCNLKCPMCFREHREIPNQNSMSFDLFKRIIGEIEGKVYSIKFTGRGEPVMHRGFSKFMDHLKGKSFGEVAMITNGQLLSEDKMQSMIDCAMDTVSFSIDGLKEDYERIRAPGKYEDIIERVAYFHAMRNRAGAKKPIIRIQSVMINETEQREFLNIWEPISDDIFFLHFKNYSADAPNIQKRKYACPMPVQRLMVHWNGTVPMCINDEYEDAVMGDLNSQTVVDIWRGETFRQARKTHMRGERTLAFKNCAKCPLTREGHGDG